MSAIQSWLLSYLLNSLWQIPLLFVAGWLAARVLKPLGPTVEHRLWVGVLFVQTLLPVASALPSKLINTISTRIGPLFAFFTHASPAAGTEISVSIGPGVRLSAVHISALLSAIVIAYAAAILYFTARFLWRCHHLHILRRDSSPVALAGEASAYWEQCLKHFSIREAAIAASTHVRCPVTIGLNRKLLLLPAAMVSGLPYADLRVVIAHEFAHMRRNDFFKNLIYECLALPVNYHPALWLTRDRILETREVICDQMAVPISTSLHADPIGAPTEYARSLLRLASLLVTGMPTRTPHAIGIFDANAFERRLMKLTQPRFQIRASRRAALFATCAVLGLATCASAFALRLSVDAMPTPTDHANSKAQDSTTVSPMEMASHIENKVTPKYPEEAKKHKIQGTVVLNAIIGKDGSVENLTVASGPKELQQSALDAVRQWTYKAYLLDGNPVDVNTTINVLFSLAK